FRFANCAAMLSVVALDEVVANPDAISFGILCLDDRPAEQAGLVPVGEVGKVSGVLNITLGITNDANDWPGKHLRDRIDRMQHAQLHAAETDERAPPL